MRGGGTYRYLGAEAGTRIPFSSKEYTKEIEGYVLKLFHSKLTAKQKVIALKRFVLPKMTHQLRSRPFSQEHLQSLDKCIRKCVRKAYNLPPDTTQGFFHTNHARGGLGITSLCHEARVMAVTQAFKMLTSPDTLISNVARASLDGRINIFCTRTKGAWRSRDSVSNEAVASFLSGRPLNQRIGNPPGVLDIWLRARAGALQVGLSLSWTQEQLLVLHMGQASIDSNNRKRVTRSLHQFMNEWWGKQWESKSSQGATFPSHSQKHHSSSWMTKDLGMSHADAAWAFRARLNLLPTQARAAKTKRPNPAGGVQNDLCRLCHEFPETQAHILNHCKPLKPQIIARHDAIMHLFNSALQDITSLNHIAMDTTARSFYDNAGVVSKPDFIIKSHDRRMIVVADVHCPYDRSDNITQSQLYKRGRYMPVVWEYADNPSWRNYNVSYRDMTIGALGSIPKETLDCLHYLGVPAAVKKTLLQEAAVLALKGSRKIWVAFLTKLYELPQSQIYR